MKIAMSLAEARLLINGNMRRLTRALRDAAVSKGEAETAERHRSEAADKALQAERKVENLTRELESAKRTTTEWREETEMLNKVVMARDTTIREKDQKITDLQKQINGWNNYLALAREEITGLNLAQTSKGKSTALTGAQAKIKVLEDLLAAKGGSEPVIPISDVSRVLNYATSGQKIRAIKLVHELTGWGLRESKDVVEGSYKAA